MRTVLSRRTLLQLGIAPAVAAAARAQDLAPTSSRVYPGTDGRLAYEPDGQGNTIHDASHAGYRGGGVAIPTLPVRETVWPVAGDNTAHVQAAIDRLSARQPDANGLRGALLLRAGQDTGTLEHWHHDVFRVRWANPFQGREYLSFALDADGTLGELRFEDRGWRLRRAR